MRKIIFAGVLVAALLTHGVGYAKCVSGQSYQLKGYMETDAGIPVTGKTLTEVVFDIKYDDGTSSLGNTATAEMINGWYRWAYTSNGKSGVYTMKDSTSTYKNFPGAPLEGVCDAQDPLAMVQAVWSEMQSTYTTAGTFGYYLDSQVSAAGGGSDPWATALPGAYGAGTAGNIIGNRVDAAITSRLASGNVTVGGYAAGQAPADSVLVTPANKLATDGTGRVTVGTNADKTGYTASTVSDKTGYSLSAAGVDAIWDEAQAGHTTAGTFGYYLDAPISTVGGGGVADWTVDEKNQLRYRLGIDGTEAAPVANLPSLGTIDANVIDKTGFSLSTAGVDAILNDTIEGAYTMRQILCAAASVLYGKASGGGTTTITFRNLGDTLNRASETVDANGNRTAVTLNLTGCQ